MELSIMIGLVLLVVIFLGVQLLWIRRIDHDRRTVAETETGTAEQRKILHEENLELREKKHSLKPASTRNRTSNLICGNAWKPQSKRESS